MKRECPTRDWMSDQQPLFRILRRAAARSAALTLPLALSAATPVILLPRQARATVELDRKYALETVGFLRAWDNVDGLFTDYVAAAFRDFFRKQSRFVLQDLSKADAVLTGSKLPYHRVIEDAEVLGQLSRVTKSQSIIRTKVQKEGSQYRFTLTWLHAPQMEQLATEEFFLKDRTDGQGLGFDDIKGQLQEALDRMIRKVPFQGMVTGRDNNSVTTNVGSLAGIRPGDALLVGTLDEVKKHPLLKEIVEWRTTRTGKLQVEQVEDGIAFCKVIEEEDGRQIGRYQKITQVIPRAPAGEIPVIQEKEEKVSQLDDPPTLGWVSGTAWLGSYSRQFSNLTGSIAKSGSGTVLGAAGEGQLWFTREWFGELRFAHGFWSYAQQDIATGTETTGNISGSVTQFKLAAGYTYLLSGDYFGPKGWVKLGLHSASYSLPLMSSESLAPSSFKAPFLGVGGDIPIREKYGVLLNLEFGLFTSASEPGNASGQVNSASDVAISVAGYYRMRPRMSLRAGFEILANSADFSSGSSVSQKVVNIAPSLVYYF